MSEVKEFLKECKEVRNNFAKIAGQYSVSEHLKLRTEIDSLLIMYDQLCERAGGAGISNENSVLNKPDVSQQRELLYGFATWHNAKPQKERYDMIYIAEVEEFLKL